MFIREVLVVLGLTLIDAVVGYPPCSSSTNSNGEIVFNCGNAFPDSERIARNQYIVWLDVSGGSSSRPIRVQVPNYRINNLVQAGANVDVKGSKTPILIELARPEINAVGQGQPVEFNAENNFEVQFAAQPVQGQHIHFSRSGDGGSERLTPLQTGQSIPRPGGFTQVRGGGHGNLLRREVPNYQIEELLQEGSNAAVDTTSIPVAVELEQPEVPTSAQVEKINDSPALPDLDVSLVTKPAEDQVLHFTKLGDEGTIQFTPTESTPKPAFGKTILNEFETTKIANLVDFVPLNLN